MIEKMFFVTLTFRLVEFGENISNLIWDTSSSRKAYSKVDEYDEIPGGVMAKWSRFSNMILLTNNAWHDGKVGVVLIFLNFINRI